MTKRWCEYQKALKPVNFLRGLGSLTRPCLNQGLASVKAIAINSTMIIPLIPSKLFTKCQ